MRQQFPGANWNIGMAAACDQGQPTIVVSMGPYPSDRRPTQLAVRTPDNAVQRFGPVTEGGPESGFHSPLVTGAEDIESLRGRRNPTRRAGIQRIQLVLQRCRARRLRGIPPTVGKLLKPPRRPKSTKPPRAPVVPSRPAQGFQTTAGSHSLEPASRIPTGTQPCKSKNPQRRIVKKPPQPRQERRPWSHKGHLSKSEVPLEDEGRTHRSSGRTDQGAHRRQKRVPGHREGPAGRLPP